MADGKWVMTEEDAKRVDLSFKGSAAQNMRELPNFGKRLCGSDDLQSGFGGCGEGFGYRSFKCRACGGETDFVYKDDVKKYFAD